MPLLSSPATVEGAQIPEPAETVLVRQGLPAAVIVVQADAAELERLAATELQSHLQAISGVLLPVVDRADSAEGVQILIGAAVPAALAVPPREADSAAFRLVVTPDRVALAGASPEGTLFAAYELLEQLGVRWFMPGELGTEIPQRTTVAVRPQEILEAPAFSLRQLWWPAETPEDQAWHRRMRRGGTYLGQHGIPAAVDPRTEPELLMEENGRPTQQLRVSSPEVLRRTVAACREQLQRHPTLRYLSMGPEDGAGFDVDPWDAGDLDPLNGRPSVTDRYLRFFNLVLEEVQQDYPQVGLAFYSYSDYMRPPVRERPNPGIVPVLAPIDLCRFHGIDNPRCWERYEYLRRIVEGWQTLGVRMSYRGYLGNLADPGMPFSMVRQVASEFPWYHAKGMIGMAPECHPAWSYHGPGLYLAARMLWNPGLEVQAVLDEYFTRFYGPAASAMRTHFDELERAYADGDFHTGNIFDVPQILTPEVMARLGQSLRQAEAAAPTGSVYARRVRLTRLGYDFGEAQLALMAALQAADFGQARELLRTILDEIIPAAVIQRPAALEPDGGGYEGYGRYMVRRFWEPVVLQGYDRVTAGNELVASLPDEWSVMLAPAGHGEDLGLWRPEAAWPTGMRLRTRSQSWSSQGLRYYKGSAWYRTAVMVDERFRGQSLRLWIGGIDDQARAWINGRSLPVLQRGEAPTGSGWEFDATGAVACGASNQVVVEVTNGTTELHEIGTGGITGPALLWAAGR